MQKILSSIVTLFICSLPLSAQEVVRDTVNFSKKSNDYVTYDKRITISEGHEMHVFTSRFSYWLSPLSGTGNLWIHCGGERSILGGEKGNTIPDWSGYSGEVHLKVYKNTDPTAGAFGLVLGHGGKTFNPEEIETSIEKGKVNSCFARSKVILHKGVTLSCESGTRGYRFGQLDTENGSSICGYYKANSGPKPYFIVGCNDSDAVMAGVIAPPSNTLKHNVGLIKEGKGTYRLTCNENYITGGLRILQGKVFVNNDVVAAQKSKLPGGVGIMNDQNSTGVYVFDKATLGGFGNVACNTDVYGRIEPGDDGIGTLTFADYVNGRKVNLMLRPTTVINCEIADAESYDRLSVSGDISLYRFGQNFVESDASPILRIRLKGAVLNVGDEFTLIRSISKKSEDGSDWQFDVRFPDRYTWETFEDTSEGNYTLKVRVISLADNPNYFDDEDDDESEEEDNNPEDFSDDDDANPLRFYADQMGKGIGVALPASKMNLKADFDKETKLVRTEFNMLVAENEMKFDALQPSRGKFSWDSADALVSLGVRRKLAVRGHTLVWHTQLPEWVTTDGKKNTNGFSRVEMLKIMKNHITTVVSHFKGKVREWDVVNECLDDVQSQVRTNPDSYVLKKTVWSEAIGNDYIDSAFVWAHQADPEALLFLNDYDVEYHGKAKTQAFYNLVKSMLDRNIPIHGVGLQCHFDAGKVDTAALSSNMKRFAQLGLVCAVTELDLGIKDYSEQQLNRQAKDYKAITQVMLDNPNCTSVMIWGLADHYSWRSASMPLIYYSSFKPKPAYFGIKKALRNTFETSLPSTPQVFRKESPSRIFNLQGVQVGSPFQGVYIQNGKKYLR